MNTKSAIALLTDFQNNLTKSLAALGLLTNGEIITSLQTKVDKSITNAANKYKQLNSQFDIINANLQLTNEELTLASNHNNTEQERLLELKKQQSELNNSLKNLTDKKELIAKNGDSKKAEIKAEIDTIKTNISKTELEINQIKQQIQDGLGLVANYNQLTQQYNIAQNQANYHNQYVQNYVIVGQERGKSGKTKDIWGWVPDTAQIKLRDDYQQEANQSKQQADGLQTQVDSFNKNLPVLQASEQSKTDQIWLYYNNLDAKNNLLLLNGTASGQDLALTDLQLSQAKTDLQQLEKTDIPTQEKTVQGTTQRVNDVQSAADKLKTDKASAQKNLADFVKNNQDLLGTDVSLDFLKDSITKVTETISTLQAQLAKPNQSVDTLKGLNQDISVQQEKLEQLKQHYQLLALEELDVNQQRLQSFNSQLAAENAVNNAIKANTIQSYADLLPQLIEQAKALSDIWIENLKTNHKLTIDISDLFQNNLTSFNQLADYIEKNLATPDINYSLNQIQLDEAIAIQDTQVKYRDALTKTVDDLGEAIELQKKSVQQGEEVAAKLQHLQNLTNYEKAYTTNKNNDLSSKLINELSQAISNKITDIPNQLDLPNNQQEQEIEVNLQKYVAQKQIKSINAKGFDGTFNELVNTVFTNGAFVADTIGRDLGEFADINGDGKQDYVVVWNANGKRALATFLAKPDGTFNEFVNTVSMSGSFLADKTGRDIGSFADINGDGRKDYVVVWNANGKRAIATYIAKTDGTFNQLVNTEFTNGAFVADTIGRDLGEFADINGDGKQDYVVVWNANGKRALATFLAKPDGTFNEFVNTISMSSSFLADKTGRDMGSFADINGDGKQDYVVVWNANGQRALATYLAKPDGTFNEFVNTVFINGAFVADTTGRDLGEFADINGDGKQDYVVPWNANGKRALATFLATGDQEKVITDLQILRLETAHLTLQAEQNPNKVQQFLQEYNASDKTASTVQSLRNKYFPELNQATTLANLQTQINKEIDQSQQQIAQVKANITQKQAQAAAALSQAAWYEQEGALHWQLSRKAGPTWTEQRSYTKKTWYGRKKTKWTTVTHVDQNWIIWDTYTKQAASFREHAANLFKGIEINTTQQNTASDILKQWQDASSIADQTAITQDQLSTLLNQLDAKRQLNGDKQQQIADWEKLLPTLQTQLQQAITDAETAKNNVTKEWTEYTKSKEEYQTALNDVLTSRTDLQVQGQQLLQEMNAVEDWVTQQSTLLNDEIIQADALITQLKTQRDATTQQLSTATGNAQTNLLTLQNLLNQSIELLTQKQVVLTSQQSTFVQKQTLLNTQKQVLETQYQLLDAYLESPDKDTSSLEKLLTDTQVTLAEVQKLAERAEASSNALTALMDDVQASLLLQNDKYLSVIREKQQTLEDLLAITELKENNTLKATQKQLELNALNTTVNDILKKANDTGSQEAAKLLEVVRNNDMATSYEIIYRDYQDLASDKGGWCVKGIARPEDRQIADNAYKKMLEYRKLKADAQQQAAQFTQLRTLAESQLNILKPAILILKKIKY